MRPLVEGVKRPVIARGDAADEFDPVVLEHEWLGLVGEQHVGERGGRHLAILGPPRGSYKSLSVPLLSV